MNTNEIVCVNFLPLLYIEGIYVNSFAFYQITDNNIRLLFHRFLPNKWICWSLGKKSLSLENIFLSLGGKFVWWRKFAIFAVSDQTLGRDQHEKLDDWLFRCG